MLQEYSIFLIIILTLVKDFLISIFLMTSASNVPIEITSILLLGPSLIRGMVFETISLSNLDLSIVSRASLLNSPKIKTFNLPCVI